MNSKRTGRLLALLPAAALLFSLSACGRQDSPADKPDATATPEFVYAADYTTLQQDEDSSFSPLLYTDEGFYAESYVKVGEEIPEGVTPEYEGQYDVYEHRYYWVDYAGSISPLTGYSPLPTPENPEGYADFQASSSIYNLAQTENGELLALESQYVSWYDGPEGVEKYSDEYYQHVESSRTYVLRRLAQDGSELSSAPLAFDMQDVYLDGGVLDDQGNFVFSFEDREGNPGVIAFDAEGQVVYQLETDSWIYRLFRLRDGRAAVTFSGPEGMELHPLDAEAKKFGEAIPVPDSAFDIVSGGGDYDFYYTSGIHFYGYDIASETSEEILDWVACDVNPDSLGKLYVDGKGVLRGIINTWSQRGDGESSVTTELITVAKKPSDQLPEKLHLTMAVLGLNYDLQAKVIDYNRHSDSCHIDVKDYSDYNTDEDNSAGLTKLTTEIMAGNMPDLLDLRGLPYSQLASKGLLEDLYPYLDGDSELNREDFFQNVLRAQEVNGGLYQVSADFQINTVLGAESVVGDQPGWTYDQLYAALDTMPEGCEIFGVGVTKDDMLEMELSLNMDRFVDWSTGQCSFDSEDFQALLDFVNRFASDYNWESYDSENDGENVRIAQGRQMLMTTTVNMFSEVQMDAIYFGGEDNLCYIGYPTADGSMGSAFRFTMALGMSANCAGKELAWDFLRTFLTEEYQNADSFGLPTNRKAFEAQLEEEMTPDWKKDAQGNILLDEDGNRIERSRGGVSFGNGQSYDIYSMTQEQADKLLYLVENTSVSLSENAQILKIVQEEAQPYFGGQKSVQEVAKLIQSKVNLYVNEQK